MQIASFATYSFSLTLYFQVLCVLPICAQDLAPFFASGIKVGEATQDSAILWVRLTEKESADFDRLAIFTEGLKPSQNLQREMPTDVVPGIAGQARVTYWTGKRKPTKSDWVNIDGQKDFTHQFKLEQLVAGRQYQYRVDSRKAKNTTAAIRSIEGKFQTAASASESVPVRFIVSTCQAIRSIDSGPDGHVAYEQMQYFKPDFLVHTGDILYYDKPPFSKNSSQARAKWNLMFAYGHNRRFHQNHTSYFMKDDHDTLKNDCWPGQKYGELTFQQGLEIFREQVPMGESTFRTVRWGRDVQIWMTENRDFRSSNRDVDGPKKTILGESQKAWLMKSVSESEATYKFVISPGPIVGPDKKGKADNHSNEAFAHEGQQLRDFLSSQDNTYVICGDRHWQYCSKDPNTGLMEFGCGPINDQHQFGGNPGQSKAFHRYFSGHGGFLAVTIDGKTAKADWYHSGEINQTTRLPKLLHTEQLGTGHLGTKPLREGPKDNLGSEK